MGKSQKLQLKRAYLRPQRNEESLARAGRWFDRAHRLRVEEEALERLVEARRAYNPRRERLAWETARHVAAWLLGSVVGLTLGVIVGTIEALGSVLGRAVARQPLIVGPALTVFVLVLLAQTLTLVKFQEDLSWTVIGQFFRRALWSGLLTAFVFSIFTGIVKRKLSSRAGQEEWPRA